MAFEHRTEGTFTVISLNEPRLDASLAESFKTYLFDLIEQSHTNLVVDLSTIRFMDSSGLGALVAGFKQLASSGTLQLAAPQPAVNDLFELTSMERIFTIHTSVDDALNEEQG